jgi:hypothetical protein
MPDMQTALKSALSRTLQQWDDDGEESPQASSTINTTINNSVSAPSQNIQGTSPTNTMTKLFNVTNNVSRSTFNYIRDNPGSKRMEIINALVDQGFGKSSVAALIAQMRNCRMVHDTNGLWYADIPEYVPIKNSNYAKKKAKATKKTTGGTGIGALLKAKIEAAPTPERVEIPANIPTQRATLTTIVRNRKPEDIIGNMTVYQARELYVHLKQMFGG